MTANVKRPLSAPEWVQDYTRDINREIDRTASGGTGGGVTGPGSSTDNGIARFDGTGGDTLASSAATVSDDGVLRSATNAGANAVSVPLVNWIKLTGNNTLTSTTAEQKIFNTTTNGALTLPTGRYYFDCWLYITSMSATSGNFSFDPVGAGTAVGAKFAYDIYGIDAANPLNPANQTGSGSISQNTGVNVLSVATSTLARARISGIFDITTGGTIIPSIALTTAAAAVINANSWFTIEKIGEAAENFVGAWT